MRRSLGFPGSLTGQGQGCFDLPWALEKKTIFLSEASGPMPRLHTQLWACPLVSLKAWHCEQAHRGPCDRHEYLTSRLSCPYIHGSTSSVNCLKYNSGCKKV